MRGMVVRRFGAISGLVLGLWITGLAGDRAALAQTQDTRSYITGTEWQAARGSEKLSYLLGIADLMSAEYAFQRKDGRAEPDRDSAIGRLQAGFTGVSIRDAAARVDAFYRNNPDQIDQTVLEALWITLVEN
jgi:hypothetical protein